MITQTEKHTNNTVEAGGTSPSVETTNCERGAIQVVFTFEEGDDSAGTIILQSSVDGVNYANIEDSEQAFTSSSTSAIWRLPDLCERSIRVAILSDGFTGEGGTYVVHSIVKRLY